MAISDKLNYLIETKSQLKEMINYGLDDDNKITSSTTFRNYAGSVFKAFLESLNNLSTLFNNLPKKSGTGSNITLNDTANAPMRIMLNASELTQDGTPTPSSPQDIHTISGDNTIRVMGKNLFDESTMQPGKNIDSSGVWESYAQSGASEIYIPVLPSTQYTYNCSSAYTLRVNKYTSNKTHIERIQKNSATDFTFTTDANCYFIRISFYAGTTVTQELVNSLHFWVEKTNEATTYEPYISQTAEVNLKSKNLFNKNNSTSSYYLGQDGTPVASNNYDYTEYIPIKPNTYYLTIGMATGTGNAPSRCYYDENKNFIIGYAHLEQTEILNASPLNAYYMRESIKKVDVDTTKIYQAPYYDYGEYCKMPNTDYKDQFIRTSGLNLAFKNIKGYVNMSNNTITIDNGSESFVFYAIEGEQYIFSSLETTNRSVLAKIDTDSPTNGTPCVSYGSVGNTFTSPFTGYACIYVNSTLNDKIKDTFMLNKGTTALPYEPYGTDEWYKESRPLKIVLDGSETWQTNASWNYTDTNCYITNIGLSNDILMSDHFTYNSGAYALDTNGIMQRVWTSQLLLRINKTLAEDTDAFKTWLSTHNVELWYVPSTPTYTKITGTLAEQLEYVYQLLKSYKGVTNISQVNNDLPFELDVSALEELV